MRSDSPSPGAGVTKDGRNASLCLSLVCAVDGARFAAVAATEQECMAQVASYVAEHSWGQLRPASAQLVHSRLAAGDTAAAVVEYFRHTGERWEREWLVTTWLNPDPRSRAWAGTVPLGDRFTMSESHRPPTQDSP